MTQYHLLRAAERVAVPWRNGGGVTREIAASPTDADTDGFDWRVSIAEVAAPGAFSRFDGVDRVLTVMAGELRLQFEDERAPATLTRDSASCTFPGDLPVFGMPVGGTVHDLNVMTRRDHWSGMIAKLDPSGVTPIEQVGGVTILVFDREGAVECDGARLSMQPLDALWVKGRGGEMSILSDGRVYVIRLSRKRDQDYAPA